jgi:Bromodomain extra-terminal - transcription regulation/Bromodomain
MASAVLSSRRDEPRWPEPAVYMKKHPPFNPNPNPSPANPNHSTVGVTLDGRVTFHVASYSRAELRELKRRLVSELEQVRSLLARIESVQPGSATVVHPNSPSRGLNSTRVEKVSSPAASALVSASLKKCGQILTRLMKHKKNVWFNSPVDALKMGLHDYHQIVKQPMDLGTVKSKLSKGSYANLSEFASDVRQTFNNALLYNPRGHVVHGLAEELLGLFEKLFSPIFESHKLQLDAMSEKQASVNHLRSQPQLQAQAHITPVTTTPVAARPVGKQPKPKARDPIKRSMTYEEKQRLSEGLQSLADDKMTQLVGIVRKRNLDTTQHGDEIELDIDSMDNETLWELDRFVSNCKKSKNRRKEGEGESMGNVDLAGARETEGVATSTADMAASSDAGTAVLTVAGSGVTDRLQDKVYHLLFFKFPTFLTFALETTASTTM